jgi:hypothetical protein
MNITHSKEKVHMSNILLQGFFDERWCENYDAQRNPYDFLFFQMGW